MRNSHKNKFKRNQDIFTSKKLKYLQFFLDNILAVLPEQIYLMDEHGKIIGCNEQQARVFGFSSYKELIGKNIYDVANRLGWDKSIPDNIRANDLFVMKNNQTVVAEECVTLGNEKRFFLSHKKPFFDDKGKIVGVVGVSIDTTDRKRAEEYRQKHEAAQKVINFSNLVSGSIAHELRVPLAGIKVHMENLRDMDCSKLPAKVVNEILRDVSESIINTVDATSYIITDMLLKIRSFATGKVYHGEVEEISIISDIENILDKYPFKKGELELIKISCDVNFKYLGDRLLTAHVLSNLIKNSLHAIQGTDKVEAYITIKTQANGDFNLLLFRDNATGISRDFMEKIFDQFETKKSIHGGTGLGLAFCKFVMTDVYGGGIACNSEEGEYTEFILSFPKIQSLKS